MSKKAVSVTLDTDNLLWLRGQAAASRRRSLSDTLDRVVTEARLGADPGDASVRSVVGTIDIGADDPGLDTADAYLRDLVMRSIRRPVVARERPPARSPGKRRRG